MFEVKNKGTIVSLLLIWNMFFRLFFSVTINDFEHEMFAGLRFWDDHRSDIFSQAFCFNNTFH